jgi:hypothetical protein
MPATAYKTSVWNGINREKVRVARAELVPLIGEEAFQYAQRPLWLLKFSVIPFVAGIVLAVCVGLTHGTLSVALGAADWTLGGIVVVGGVLLFHWMFKTRRLASDYVSAQCGFPIKTRGALLNVEEWKLEIDRAKQRYWQEHPEAKAGVERTDGSDG